MNLATVITNRAVLMRTFRSSVDREEELWRDAKFQQVREQHLGPLAAENERFDRDLATVAAALKLASRRLEETR